MNHLREAGQIRNVTRNLENEYDSDSVDEDIEAEPPLRVERHAQQERRVAMATIQPRFTRIRIGERTNIAPQTEEACQERRAGRVVRANATPEKTQEYRQMPEEPRRNQQGFTRARRGVALPDYDSYEWEDP